MGLCCLWKFFTFDQDWAKEHISKFPTYLYLSFPKTISLKAFGLCVSHVMSFHLNIVFNQKVLNQKSMK